MDVVTVNFHPCSSSLEDALLKVKVEASTVTEISETLKDNCNFTDCSCRMMCSANGKRFEIKLLDRNKSGMY